MDELNSVAVIGLAGIFPGARTLAEHWRNLFDGRESISHWEDPDMGERFRGAKGVFPDATLFKRSLFGMNEPDARLMDPQIRKLLELSWLALDDAGIATSPTEGTDVGVYVTSAASDHALTAQADARLRRDVGRLQVRLLTDRDFTATRVSYHLNLTGPSKTVQTACSSSLVAVHDAVTAVLLGETGAAIAGGIAIDTPAREGYEWFEGGIGSATGRIRPFDAHADGAVGGNGGGLVVLKRLDHALHDGDRIYATILGTAVGNDGNAKVGFTAPSVDGHASVIRAAWEMAGRSPAEMNYFEGHGTGTAIGDPIELAALAEARGASIPAGREGSATLIGSVKGNLGHLDTAAGIASLIKAVLMAHHRLFVPTPGLTDLAQGVASNASHVRICSATEPAPESSLIGVSSLGIGGTNAHVVVAGMPPAPAAEGSTGPVLLPVSVRDREDGLPHAAAIADALEADLPALSAVASTLQTGRRELPVRAVVIANDLAGAIDGLRTVDFEEITKQQPRLRVTFPGQTSYVEGVGEGLARQWPTYAASLDRSASTLRPFNIDPRVRVADPSDTAVVQPVIVSHQIALLETLRSYGVEAAEYVGHSLGEFTVAVARGLADPGDVLRAVAERGRLMSSTAPGRMIAVNATPEQAARWSGPCVAIAAHNGTDRMVLSGLAAELERVAGELKEQRIPHVWLSSRRGFHSPLMDPVIDDMTAVAARLVSVMDADHVGLWNSSVDGTRIDARMALQPEYWVRQMRGTVRWHDITTALDGSSDVTVECGSGDELTQLARKHRDGPQPIAMRPSPHRPEADQLLEALGKLWINGAGLTWPQALTPRRRCGLPGQPMTGPEHGYLTSAEAISSAPDQLVSGAPSSSQEQTTASPEGGAGDLADNGDDPEAKVHRILAAVLGEQALLDDRSFLESGGDSLAAVQVIARIQDAVGTAVEITSLVSAERLSDFVAAVGSSISFVDTTTEIDDLDSLIASFESGSK